MHGTNVKIPIGNIGESLSAPLLVLYVSRQWNQKSNSGIVITLSVAETAWYGFLSTHLLTYLLHGAESFLRS